jgi:DNA-binding transcriptional MerR regulator
VIISFFAAQSTYLFSIGEIATVCGVSIDTLRFYETKALITPAHVDPESGYRYYRRENLLRFRTILELKDAGLSLLEIKDYLDGVRHTENKIAELTERRDLLNRAIEDLQIRVVKPGDFTVSEIELPERLCLCRTIIAKDGVNALRAIGEFYDELIHDGVPFSSIWPVFCEYPDEGLLKGEFSTTDFTVRACLPVDQKSAPPEAVRYPAGRALAVNYRGSYYDLWKAYSALSQYIDETGMFRRVILSKSIWKPKLTVKCTWMNLKISPE